MSTRLKNQNHGSFTNILIPQLHEEHCQKLQQTLEKQSTAYLNSIATRRQV